jgi:hypothetical protein
MSCPNLFSQVLVAHACNSNYSGGGDQSGKYFERPYLKNTLCKKGVVVWLKVWALSSNPSTVVGGKVVLKQF